MSGDEMLEILRGDLSHLKAEFGVKRIGIFGSYARGRENEASDVDVIVEFARPIGLKFMPFCDYLEELLGHKADVLTPAGVNGIRNKKIADNIMGSIVYV
jgi:predicted nucleotidyltransferase